MRGAFTGNPVALMKTYISYEISRVESSTCKEVCIDSVLLHQLITDIALAMNLDWLFKEYCSFLSNRKITPGFNTGNFPFLVEKFKEWDIDLGNVLVAAPFNKVGFQMMPSIIECERALKTVPTPFVVAISILAAGFVDLKEAASYINGLTNIKGVALGVSKLKHAQETFRLFQSALK